MQGLGSTTPKSMVKYVCAGWISQASVTSAIFAGEGYTGNPRVFDGESDSQSFTAQSDGNRR